MAQDPPVIPAKEGSHPHERDAPNVVAEPVYSALGEASIGRHVKKKPY